jgi:transcriptional regulator with XRE-family HTH domain
MKEGIRDILFKELAQRGVTIYSFSSQTGIPKSRVYQWKNGNGTPKADDAEIIRKWISQEVAILEEPLPQYGTITMPVAERIEELKNDKRVLQETIASNLQTIHASQDLLMVLMRSVYDQTVEIKQLMAAPQIPDKGSKADLVLTKSGRGTKN